MILILQKMQLIDFNTYTAAEFLLPDKVHFSFWIHFGKTYLFVYIKPKLLNNQAFHLKTEVDEQLSGHKVSWLYDRKLQQ